MTQEARMKVCIIGAGANTRERHIPHLRSLDGVELLGVVDLVLAVLARHRHRGHLWGDDLRLEVRFADGRYAPAERPAAGAKKVR